MTDSFLTTQAKCRPTQNIHQNHSRRAESVLIGAHGARYSCYGALIVKAALAPELLIWAESKVTGFQCGELPSSV